MQFKFSDRPQIKCEADQTAEYVYLNLRNVSVTQSQPSSGAKAKEAKSFSVTGTCRLVIDSAHVVSVGLNCCQETRPNGNDMRLLEASHNFQVCNPRKLMSTCERDFTEQYTGLC